MISSPAPAPPALDRVAGFPDDPIAVMDPGPRNATRRRYPFVAASAMAVTADARVADR